MDTKEITFSNLTLKDVKNSETVNTFIQVANDYLGAIGYTEHGYRHVTLVSATAEKILKSLGYPKRLQELAAIAGYVHDIGNVINRHDHGQSAALISMGILRKVGFTTDEIALIISAVGNHEEEIGEPVNPVAAALMIADKADVHKTRVRNPNLEQFDIHDRVNFAVDKASLDINKDKRIISLNLTIDTKISQVIEYFEIFMLRMNICRKAANFLNCKFELIINERKLL